MIDNLNEVNRLIIAVNRLSINHKGALEAAVIRFCKDMVVEGRFPDHKSTIKFLITCGIVTRISNRLQLTELGRELLDLNPQLSYELNEKQKRCLITKCLLKGKQSLQVAEMLKQFVPAYLSKTYQWSPIDNKPLKDDHKIINIMRQSGLLRETKGVLEVDHIYVGIVKEVIKPTNIITLEELIQSLQTAHQVGKIAEEIVLRYEKKRLLQQDFLVESQCVQKISDLNVAAGYDIASYNGYKKDLVHNRFIEVKGSANENVSFYWTKNEIEQAKRLGSNYWIYFVRNIDIKNEVGDPNPILIQNPADNILSSDRFKYECIQLLIKMKDGCQDFTF